MIPKSGNRFSEKIMLHKKLDDPEKWDRFSEKIMLHKKIEQDGEAPGGTRAATYNSATVLPVGHSSAQSFAAQNSSTNRPISR
jgi:hypothetical protein